MKRLSVIMAAILAAGAIEIGIAKSGSTVNKSLCISKANSTVTDTVPGKKRRNPNRPTRRDTVTRPTRDTVSPTRPTNPTPTNPTTPTPPAPPTNPSSPTTPTTPTNPTNLTTPKPPVK